jgi:hypothetical protein
MSFPRWSVGDSPRTVSAKARTSERMSSASGGSSMAFARATPRRVSATTSAAATPGVSSDSNVVARRM